MNWSAKRGTKCQNKMLCHNRWFWYNQNICLFIDSDDVFGTADWAGKKTTFLLWSLKTPSSNWPNAWKGLTMSWQIFLRHRMQHCEKIQKDLWEICLFLPEFMFRSLNNNYDFDVWEITLNYINLDILNVNFNFVHMNVYLSKHTIMCVSSIVSCASLCFISFKCA